MAKPSGAAPPLQRVEILLCQGQRRRCRSRSLARPFSAIVLGCDIAEGEGGTLLHSASDLVILTQVSVFAFKTCVYLSCIIVDMTLDAPKIKATLKANLETSIERAVSVQCWVERGGSFYDLRCHRKMLCSRRRRKDSPFKYYWALNSRMAFAILTRTGKGWRITLANRHRAGWSLSLIQAVCTLAGTIYLRCIQCNILVMTLVAAKTSATFEGIFRNLN